MLLLLVTRHCRLRHTLCMITLVLILLLFLLMRQELTELLCAVNVDSRGQFLIWRLRSMVGTTGDAFHYFEAESRLGNTKFDVGEFLCIIVPKTEEVKGVALVYNQERNQAPLLRTRLPRDFSLDQVPLLPTGAFSSLNSLVLHMVKL